MKHTYLLQPSYHRSTRYSGISITEFLGCVVAMAGGLFLGGLYLGVDLNELTEVAIEEAEAIAPQYFAANETTDPQTEVSTPEDVAAAAAGSQVDTEVSQGESVAESAPPRDGASEPEPAAVPEPTPEERSQATHTYWQLLTQCMVEEAQNRMADATSVEDLQLYEYITRRKEAHEHAVEELDAFDSFAVDERLLAHSQQIVTWHRQGIQLFGRAQGLLTDNPTGVAPGAISQSWQSASTQHRMEENLLLEKHKTLATYLDHTYSEQAPFTPAFH